MQALPILVAKGAIETSLLYGLVMAPLFFTRVGAVLFISRPVFMEINEEESAGSAVVE